MTLFLGNLSVDDIAARIVAYEAPMSWASCLAKDVYGAWVPLHLTVIGGAPLDPLTVCYPRLRLQIETLDSGSAASRLKDGLFASIDGEALPFLAQTGASHQEYRVFSQESFGIAGSRLWPETYFDITNAQIATTLDVRWEQPLTGRGLPYYSTPEAFLNDLLYQGNLQNVSSGSWPRLFVRLPDLRGRIRSVAVTSADGILVAYERENRSLEAKIVIEQRTERFWRRIVARESRRAAARRGQCRCRIHPETERITAALVTTQGDLVDQRDVPVRMETATVATTTLGLMESMDYLDAVWRSIPVLGAEPLVLAPSLLSVASLEQPASTRSEVLQRLIDLADLLRRWHIPDGALATAIAEDKKSQSLERLVNAVRGRLNTTDQLTFDEGVATLRAVGRLRVAMAHPSASREVERACRQLGASFPPDWEELWAIVRIRTIAALKQIRETVMTLRESSKAS